MRGANDGNIGADEIARTLGLVPHPREGGFFREIYRAAETIAPDALPRRYGAPRAFGTAIYYLLTPATFSAMHRLASDEIFHFYLGDPVEQLRLRPDGGGERVRLGTDLAAGERPVAIVPKGVWQGARLAPGGRFALMGCTVAPGFDYADYEHGNRASLVAAYPAWAGAIGALTES